jgi:peptidoglycan-N-acetylglucosamine deacetylase
MVKKNITLFIFILFITVLITIGVLFHNQIYFRAAAFFNHDDIDWMGFTNEKIVALTFDDGPDPRFTPKVLEILKKYHIPATFFVEGINVSEYPELVLEEYKSGHTIGNHTFTHPHLSILTVTGVKDEITFTDDEIQKITGEIPALFRPPYEELTDNIIKASRELHRTIIMSTITLEHTSDPTAKTEADRVSNLIFPGAIILAHDGRLNRSKSVSALHFLIQALTAKGYRFVSMSELLKKNFKISTSKGINSRWKSCNGGDNQINRVTIKKPGVFPRHFFDYFARKQSRHNTSRS